MKIITFVLFISSLLVAHTAHAQISIFKNSYQLFKGEIQNKAVDKTGLMESFTLALQWGVDEGQSQEAYNFAWNSSGKYTLEIEGDTVEVSRNALAKFPDLIKRFDSLKPSRLNIQLYGESYGTSNEDQYSIYYELGNRLLHYKISGTAENELVPVEPQLWNEFLTWGDETEFTTAMDRWILPYNDFRSKKDDGLNKSFADYERLDNSQKTALNNRLQANFDKTVEFSMNVEIGTLNWPVNEMKSIAVDLNKRLANEEVEAEDSFWSGEEVDDGEKDDFDFWEGGSESDTEDKTATEPPEAN